VSSSSRGICAYRAGSSREPQSAAVAPVEPVGYVGDVGDNGYRGQAHAENQPFNARQRRSALAARCAAPASVPRDRLRSEDGQHHCNVSVLVFARIRLEAYAALQHPT